MIVSVASGKGGTGKTTVTASLASVWDGSVVAVDLDVEAPNLHLFLRPAWGGRESAFMAIPSVDESRCTHCGACSELCQFKAISAVGSLLLTFPDMCHGCGGCIAVCPEIAITPGKRELGDIAWGKAAKAGFLMGRLRVGEAMSPPLMRMVKAKLSEMLAMRGGDAVIDAPPGVSCPAANAVMDSDAIVLVTEPTPFGFHDFKLAWEAFSPLKIPMGAVVNRAGLGDDSVYAFCKDKGVPILAEIPYDRAVAETYARGGIIAEESSQWKAVFVALLYRIRGLSAESGTREAAHA